MKMPIRAKQVERNAQVDNSKGPAQLGNREKVSRFGLIRFANTIAFVLDEPVLLRSITTLILTALLILQSVVPCCAVSSLLTKNRKSDTSSLQAACPCSCCPHSSLKHRKVPPNDGHSPDARCPFCDGLLFHRATDNTVITHKAEGNIGLVGLLCVPVRLNSKYVRIRVTIESQCLGWSSLNAGMRLLI